MLFLVLAILGAAAVAFVATRQKGSAPPAPTVPPPAPPLPHPAPSGTWTQMVPPYVLQPGVLYRASCAPIPGGKATDMANAVDQFAQSSMTTVWATYPADWPRSDPPSRWRFDFVHDKTKPPLTLSDIPSDWRFFSKT
jgi:hypothetical protein